MVSCPLSSRDGVYRDIHAPDPSLLARSPEELLGRSVEEVMPPDFAFPTRDVDVWQSVAWKPANMFQVGFRRAHWLRA